MRYVKPELELIRFQNHDILTDSDELPIDIVLPPLYADLNSLRKIGVEHEDTEGSAPLPLLSAAKISEDEHLCNRLLI